MPEMAIKSPKKSKKKVDKGIGWGKTLPYADSLGKFIRLSHYPIRNEPVFTL
jgi:hypothetical protein